MVGEIKNKNQAEILKKLIQKNLRGHIFNLLSETRDIRDQRDQINLISEARGLRTIGVFKAN